MCWVLFGFDFGDEFVENVDVCVVGRDGGVVIWYLDGDFDVDVVFFGCFGFCKEGVLCFFEVGVFVNNDSDIIFVVFFLKEGRKG